MQRREVRSALYVQANTQKRGVRSALYVQVNAKKRSKECVIRVSECKEED